MKMVVAFGTAAAAEVVGENYMNAPSYTAWNNMIMLFPLVSSAATVIMLPYSFVLFFFVLLP